MNLKDLGREVLRATMAATKTEGAWVAMTNGRAYPGGLGKLTPNHGQYPHPSPRRVVRDGLELELDISDLIDWYMYFGFDDPSKRQLLDQCRPGDVALDIGANIGITALVMARQFGPGGRVFAFEPNPDTFARLERHLQLNDKGSIEAIRVGLGDRPGQLRMKVADAGNRGMNRIDPDGEQIVPITTVDRFVAERGLGKLDLAKIDVEGFEVAVLRGASATLRKHRPRLFVELDDGLLKRQGESAESLLGLLDELGYTAFDANTGKPVSARPGIHIDIFCHPEGARA